MRGDHKGIEAGRRVEQGKADVLTVDPLGLAVGKIDKFVRHLTELLIDLFFAQMVLGFVLIAHLFSLAPRSTPAHHSSQIRQSAPLRLRSGHGVG